MVIAALTTDEPDAASRRVVRGAGTGAVRLALSDAFLKELVEVVRRKDRQGLIVSASWAFEAALDLWAHGTLHHPLRLDWPSVVDRKDHWVLDLAWASTADYIVAWDPHLTRATMPFPIDVVEPPELCRRLGL